MFIRTMGKCKAKDEFKRCKNEAEWKDGYCIRHYEINLKLKWKERKKRSGN